MNHRGENGKAPPGAGVYFGTIEDEMATFDSLPRRVREAMAACACKVAATPISNRLLNNADAGMDAKANVDEVIAAIHDYESRDIAGFNGLAFRAGVSVQRPYSGNTL